MRNVRQTRVPFQLKMSLAEHLCKPSVLIVDCRSNDECAVGDGYKGAVNIPVTEISDRAAECVADKARPIVCYCKGGMRAMKAADILKEHGYTNVIAGGNATKLREAKND